MKLLIRRAEQVPLLSIWILFLLCMVPGCAYGKDINLTAGLGFEFATGSYGTDQTSDSFSIPLTIRYDPVERFGLELVVPYIYQSDGSTTAAGMFRFRNGRTGAGTTASGFKGKGPFQAGQSATLSSSRSGIGDLSLKLGSVVWPGSSVSPRIRPLLYALFPTGDADRGLGTGTFSGGGGVELSTWFGGWYVYGEGIYVIQEKSAEFDLKNYVSYEAGIAYQVTDRFRPALLVRGVTAPSGYSSALAEVRLKSSYRLSGRISLEAYLGTGLTSQSQDFGAGVSLFYDF